jgi:hypothetical protein
MPTVYRIIRDKFRHDCPFYGRKQAAWAPAGTPEALVFYTLLRHRNWNWSKHWPTLRVSATKICPFTGFLPFKFRTISVIIPERTCPPTGRIKTYSRTQFWLKDWVLSPDVLAVGIPSVIVPFSHNIIVHPTHPLFSQVTLLSQEQIPIDRRLWRG